MNSSLSTTRVFGIYRGAIIDGSRGFQPTGIDDPNLFRRGATADWVAAHGVAPGFMRRSATRFIIRAMVRGLKPTATLTMSLRDKDTLPGRGATIDGSRAFQRPDKGPVKVLRRVATLDVYGLPNESRH